MSEGRWLKVHLGYMMGIVLGVLLAKSSPVRVIDVATWGPQILILCKYHMDDGLNRRYP